MADVKIQDLAPIPSQTGDDLYEVSDNGTGSYKETRADMLAYMQTELANVFLEKANNLSDLANRVTAAGNAGIPQGELSYIANSDYAMSNPPFAINNFNFPNSLRSVFLPVANTSTSVQVGYQLIVVNESYSNTFLLKTASGTILATVFPREKISVNLIDNSTADGIWDLLYQVFSVNNTTEGLVITSNKRACRVATTGNLNATYNNSTFRLTSNVNGAITIDSVPLALNNRVLVKNQTSNVENGIYVVIDVGSAGTPYILERAVDYRYVIGTTLYGMIQAGDIVSVGEGNQNAGTIYLQIGTPVTIGVDPIIFESIEDINQVEILNANRNITLADNKKIFLCDPVTTFNVTFPDPSTLFAGFECTFKHINNNPTTYVNILPTSPSTIDYYGFGTIGNLQSVKYVVDGTSSNSNISSIADSGFGQCPHIIYNVVPDSYTLQSKDNGALIVYNTNNTTKTVTLPQNSTLALKAGFWVEVFNPSANIITVVLQGSDTLIGSTTIYPNQTVKFIKTTFGSPNAWMVTKRFGDVIQSKYVYRQVSTPYTMLATDLNANIVNVTNGAVISLPQIGSTTAPQGYTVNVLNRSNSVCSLGAFLITEFIDGINVVRLQPWESMQVISDGSTNWTIISRSSDFKQNCSTTALTYVDLTNNGNYYQLVQDYIYAFRAEINGTNFTSNYYASFIIEGVIRRNSVNTAFVGTPAITVLGRTNANYEAQAIADNANSRLTFQVRSDTGQAMDWLARIHSNISQITY